MEIRPFTVSPTWLYAPSSCLPLSLVWLQISAVSIFNNSLCSLLRCSSPSSNLITSFSFSFSTLCNSSALICSKSQTWTFTIFSSCLSSILIHGTAVTPCGLGESGQWHPSEKWWTHLSHSNIWLVWHSLVFLLGNLLPAPLLSLFLIIFFLIFFFFFLTFRFLTLGSISLLSSLLLSSSKGGDAGTSSSSTFLCWFVYRHPPLSSLPVLNLHR